MTTKVSKAEDPMNVAQTVGLPTLTKTKKSEKRPKRRPDFAFSGPVYVRPIGRGIVLGGADGTQQLEDAAEVAVPGGDAYLVVRIWRSKVRQG